MRLLFVALSLLALTPASALSAAPRPAGQPGVHRPCPNDPAVRWARSHKGVEFRKLTDLPPAETYAAVYRRGPDGCMIPVLFRERSAAPTRRR